MTSRSLMLITVLALALAGAFLAFRNVGNRLVSDGPEIASTENGSQTTQAPELPFRSIGAGEKGGRVVVDKIIGSGGSVDTPRPAD